MPDKKREVYIFDIDDTIADLDLTLTNMIYILTGDRISEDEMKNRKFLRPSVCGFISEDEEERIILMLEELNGFAYLKTIDGALQFIQKNVMERENGTLIYLTARSIRAHDQTLEWMRRNRFPIPNDVNTFDSKVSLFMNDDRENKESNLRRISDVHFNNNLHYFENDPKYVNYAVELCIPNIHIFDNSYVSGNIFPENVKKINYEFYKTNISA